MPLACLRGETNQDTLRKLCLHFRWKWMIYDRGDNFPFNFNQFQYFPLVQPYKPNGFTFGSKCKEKNRHHDHIPFIFKGTGNVVFSVFLGKLIKGLITHTQVNYFRILLNQTEIKLYSPCTDSFGTKRTSVNPLRPISSFLHVFEPN